MSAAEDRISEIMSEIYGSLPRQGPGSAASTRRAFSMLGALPERPLVLDIGCGTGAQTLELAKLTNGHITALDVFDWALDGVSRKASAEGMYERIHTTKQSMTEMGFQGKTFDLVWSEGALYIMGFENALNSCRFLLKPGGFLAASELCWFRDDPPDEARAFFRMCYPEMKTVTDNVQLINSSGYLLLGHFDLPDRDWWDDYYTPMSKLLPALREKYSTLPEALAVLDENEEEMEIHRKYSEWYGYEFFISRRPPDW